MATRATAPPRDVDDEALMGEQRPPVHLHRLAQLDEDAAPADLGHRVDVEAVPRQGRHGPLQQLEVGAAALDVVAEGSEPHHVRGHARLDRGPVLRRDGPEVALGQRACARATPPSCPTRYRRPRARPAWTADQLSALACGSALT